MALSTTKFRENYYPVWFLMTAMLVAGAWGVFPTQALQLLVSSAHADDSNKQPAELMFVQSSDDLKVDTTENTLRLVNINQQTLFFSDRPVRLAGHLEMEDYLQEWTKGENNFGEDPPNASLSVYENGQSENTVVVVELTRPVVDGADLVYHYELIDGTMPKNGGPTALFIDWIGVGGGVGVGYHGVGVGRRGPGVRR